MTRRAKQRVGRVLKDKWRLEKLLGVGGTAAVYLAKHRNGQKVAVKMLHPELTEDEELRTRFLREGYVANKVAHPGALAVLDDDVDEDGAVFLVMELLDGETLDARWKRNNRIMNPAEVMLIASQVLDVLEAAAEKGITHRDIKPENLFITKEGQVKVLDFGIARLRESLGRIRLTQTGTALGTPAFMAPEQARGRSELIDGQTDLWGLGATMFTLMSGRLVHEAETGNEQLLAAMMRPARSLMTVAPNVPHAVMAVVDKSLMFEKKDRFPDAASMRAAARAAFGQITGAPMESAARVAPPSVTGVSTTGMGSVPPSMDWGATTREPQMIPPARRALLTIRERWISVLAISVGTVAVLLLGVSYAVARHSGSDVTVNGKAAGTNGSATMPSPSASVSAAVATSPSTVSSAIPSAVTTGTAALVVTVDASASAVPIKPKSTWKPPVVSNDNDDPGPIRK